MSMLRSWTWPHSGQEAFWSVFRPKCNTFVETRVKTETWIFLTLGDMILSHTLITKSLTCLAGTCLAGTLKQLRIWDGNDCSRVGHIFSHITCLRFVRMWEVIPHPKDTDSHEPFTERKKWSRYGSTVEPFSCPQDVPHLGTVLVQSGTVFPNSSTVEPFWLHFFFSVWYCKGPRSFLVLRQPLPFQIAIKQVMTWLQA